MKTEKEQKVCLLCGEINKLINAHIIPRWAFDYLYKDVPDEYKNDSLLLIGEGREKRRPIGPYDSNLLCKRCDNFLGGFDDYAKRIFLDSNMIKNGNLSYLIKDVNFKKIRIFLLSMIWRASVSNREEFNEISIGPYEDRIKNILNDLRNGKDKEFAKEYPFIVSKYDKGDLPESVVNKNISVPHTKKIDGINFVIFYLPKGYKIFIKLDKRDCPNSLKKIANLQRGDLIIPIIGNYSDTNEFRRLLKTVRK